MDSPKTWSELFSLHLTTHGLTQQQAAFALKMGPSKISYWRRGTRPRCEQDRKKIERWSNGAVPADAPESHAPPAADSSTSLTRGRRARQAS